jgi:hypothetical protein
MMRTMRGDKASEGAARMLGNSLRRKRNPCRTATPRSSRKAQHESAFQTDMFDLQPPRHIPTLPKTVRRELGRNGIKFDSVSVRGPMDQRHALEYVVGFSEVFHYAAF